jgi:hypothetical protein
MEKLNCLTLEMSAEDDIQLLRDLLDKYVEKMDRKTYDTGQGALDRLNHRNLTYRTSIDRDWNQFRIPIQFFFSQERQFAIHMFILFGFHEHDDPNTGPG